ncbi:MAG: monovalent cation/H+ antiporter complex subunit F [Thermoplasmatota archaeon]
MSWMDTTVQVAMVAIAAAMLLTLIRLLRGPTVPDRVISLDLLTLQALGLTCAAAVFYDQSDFLDAAIILALLAFLSTIAFARHVERRAMQQETYRE